LSGFSHFNKVSAEVEIALSAQTPPLCVLAALARYPLAALPWWKGDLLMAKRKSRIVWEDTGIRNGSPAIGGTHRLGQRVNHYGHGGRDEWLRQEDNHRMRRLPPVLPNVVIPGLTGAVGALLGYGAMYATILAWAVYCEHHPYAFIGKEWTINFRLWEVSEEVCAAVGAILGVLLGVWLARRLVAAWKSP
jgi:hypothetical protein